MVLAAIHRNGPATSAEIIHRGGLGTNTNLYRARFTELHDRGRVITTGKRTCTITGRRVLVWQVTAPRVAKPRVAKPRPRISQQCREEAAELMQLCASNPGRYTEISAWARVACPRAWSFAHSAMVYAWGLYRPDWVQMEKDAEAEARLRTGWRIPA